MCINEIYIYVCLKNSVCEYMCVYMRLHLCRYISFRLNLTKKLHQKPSRSGCPKEKLKVDQTSCKFWPAYTNQAENFLLAGIFKISGRNPGVGLQLII